MIIVPQAEQTGPSRLDEWIETNFERWHSLVEDLPADAGPRLTHGHYCFAYEIIGDRKQITLQHLPDIVRASEIRHTGWPPFWFPTHAENKPYPIEGSYNRKLVTVERAAYHGDANRRHFSGNKGQAK